MTSNHIPTTWSAPTLDLARPLPIAWAAFLPTFYTALISIEPSSDYGILGAFLDPDILASFQGQHDLQPFTVLTAQGPYPHTATQAQRDEHTAAVLAFDRQRAQIRHAQAVLHGVLPLELKDLFLSPDFMAFNFGTPVHQLQTIVAAIGPITRTQLAEAAASTRDPYVPPGCIRAFVTRHEAFHKLRANVRSPIPEVDKVAAFHAAITASGVFSLPLHLWEDRFPRPDQQTFANLKEAILTSAPVILRTTSVGAGYAAATAPHPQQQRPPQYCWTHGMGHSSASCRNPAPGHQKTATESNRLGGR